jgi:hypothetical protein
VRAESMADLLVVEKGVTLVEQKVAKMVDK